MDDLKVGCVIPAINTQMKTFIIKVDEKKKDIHGDMPLVERPRELILCKDCKHHGSENCPLFTDAVEFVTDDDWFCADGERKDGDPNG